MGCTLPVFLFFKFSSGRNVFLFTHLGLAAQRWPSYGPATCQVMQLVTHGMPRRDWSTTWKWPLPVILQAKSGEHGGSTFKKTETKSCYYLVNGYFIGPENTLEEFLSCDSPLVIRLTLQTIQFMRGWLLSQQMETCLTSLCFSRINQGTGENNTGWLTWSLKRMFPWESSMFVSRSDDFMW